MRSNIQMLEIELEELIKQALKNGLTYPEYRVLVENHADSFTSTGHTQTEALSNYTILNNRRMKRWDKTFKLSENHKNRIEQITAPLNWLILTESWCGDAAHIIPVMNKLAELSPNINLQIILRDDNTQLMDAFLTNGAMSIPKLIIQDAESKRILGSWGPRPSVAADLVDDYKAEKGLLTPDFKEELQIWYNNDKGQTTAEDIISLQEQLVQI
ncbi:MAG: thioredoxin family protein [Leeuwenhoekiella sp.]